jgi:hypothetical protein
MDSDISSKTSATVEQRKKMLIAEGAMYRLGLREARHEVLSGMRIDTLTKTAFDHLAANGQAAFERVFSMQGLKNFNPANLKILTPLLLPLLTRGFSTLSRRRDLIKPVVVGSASLLAVAGIGFLVFRWKKVRQANSASRQLYTTRTRG